MALRAFPRKPKTALQLIYNLLIVRNIDGLMRKIFGQSWNDNNEKSCIEKTHKNIGLF